MRHTKKDLRRGILASRSLKLHSNGSWKFIRVMWNSEWTEAIYAINLQKFTSSSLLRKDLTQVCLLARALLILTSFLHSSDNTASGKA